MNVSDVDLLTSSERPRLLSLIKATAKADGDLGFENQAEYQSGVETSHTYALPLRVLDWIFYRTIAGYLLRPLNPLVAWLAFCALAAAIRLARRRDLADCPWRVLNGAGFAA